MQIFKKNVQSEIVTFGYTGENQTHETPTNRMNPSICFFENGEPNKAGVGESVCTLLTTEGLRLLTNGLVQLLL